MLDRHSPLYLTEKFTLQNRVVIPPMASTTAASDGSVTQKTLEHYTNLARAGAGLVIAEYSFVHSSGRSEENQLGISEDSQIPGLAKIAERIHAAGAFAGVQITHGGGKSSSELTHGNFMGPSAIAVPVKGEALETPRAMTLDDIELWKNSFIQAADRAVLAGFDLVEFHSAHGYGLNQWLSPLTNQRTDSYGQDLMGRSRLLREIVAAVRKVHPQLLLSVRLPGQDFLEGGLKTKDSIEIAKMLVELGLNILHISSGIGGWRRPTTRIGEGYLVSEATEIQAEITIPVIGVGGIETGNYIDEALREKKFSLAAVGRAILKDPTAFKERQLLQPSIA